MFIVYNQLFAFQTFYYNFISWMGLWIYNETSSLLPDFKFQLHQKQQNIHNTHIIWIVIIDL